MIHGVRGKEREATEKGMRTGGRCGGVEREGGKEGKDCIPGERGRGREAKA